MSRRRRVTNPPRDWLVIPFPLRTNFVATVEVPRDLTLAEAERLAAFVLALAQPLERAEVAPLATAAQPPEPPE